MLQFPYTDAPLPGQYIIQTTLRVFTITANGLVAARSAACRALSHQERILTIQFTKAPASGNVTVEPASPFNP